MVAIIEVRGINVLFMPQTPDNNIGVQQSINAVELAITNAVTRSIVFCSCLNSAHVNQNIITATTTPSTRLMTIVNALPCSVNLGLSPLVHIGISMGSFRYVDYYTDCLVCNVNSEMNANICN